MCPQASHPLPFDTISFETRQAFLDALAALSMAFGIVAHCATLMPMEADAEAYGVGPDGYLMAATIATLSYQPDIWGHRGRNDPRPRFITTAFASVTAHDRLRILRDARRPAAAI